MAAYDVAPLNPLGAWRPYRVRIRCVKRSGGDIGNSPGPACGNVTRRLWLDAARSADHSVAAVESMECPARNAAVEPNFLHRDLPDISVKVMHLNEGAAYRERHLPTVAHYEVVTNPFPAARATDGDEGGADRDEPQTHEPKVPRMGQRAGMSPDGVRFGLGATGPGQSEDQSKRLFWARPEFAHHRFAACSDEMTEDERDDDRIVELSGHRDEVGDEVEGQGEIGDEGDQQQLATPWHAGIACEARHEHDAVGDERGKCTCVLVAAVHHQPGEE